MEIVSSLVSAEPQQATALTVERVESMNWDEAIQALALILAKIIDREPRDEGSEWIRIKEAARMSGMSPFFFYDHWRNLPFCKKPAGSILINRKEFVRWISNPSGRSK
jgi:hypothetical protein